MKKNVVILAPISNHYINYYDVVKKDTEDSFLLFILSKHRDNYPSKLPSNVNLVELSKWNEPFIDYYIGYYFNNHIDIIFAYTEDQIEFAAKLRQKYKVPGQNVQSALEFRNKYIMTKKAHDSGLDVPKFEKVNDICDLIKASKKLGYPFVIKPIDGMGSMNTYKITNFDNLMEVAKKEIIKNYLAEEYIKWPLYHVDAFTVNDEIKYLVVSRYFDNTLAYKDNISVGSVQISNTSALTPADARAAFQQGNVDAWAIWDPYYSAALLQGGVRVLKDGTDLNQTGSFYLAARPYAEKNGAFIQGVLATFSEADALTRSQREQSIALLAKTMGLPAPVIASYLDHRPPTTIKPVNAEIAALQQQTADLFYENRLVPKKVDIRQRIWQPTQLEGKQL